MRTRFLSVIASAVLIGLTTTSIHASTHKRHAAPPVVVVPKGWPQHFQLTRFHVVAPVEDNDFRSPKSVHAPYKWGDVAWYDLSAKPGAPGRSIIFGHLDSTCCPAVFYHLRDTKPGDTVQVSYKTGKPLKFRIIWVQTYPNTKLPMKWMYGATRERSLILVTCSGVFHLDGSGYDHKFIAYARLVLPNGKLG